MAIEILKGNEIEPGTKVRITGISLRDAHDPKDVIGREGEYNGRFGVWLDDMNLWHFIDGLTLEKI